MEENLIHTMVYGESERDRSDAWLEFITHTDQDIKLYLAAGKLPFSSKEYLNKEMFYYLATRLIDANYRFLDRGPFANECNSFVKGDRTINIIVIEKRFWDTFGTLEETFSVANYLGLTRNYTLTVFSSHEHLARIQKTWKLIAPSYAIVPVASQITMDPRLTSFENKKDRLTDILYFAYQYGGENGLGIASFLKNWILNVIFKVQEQKK